MVEAMELYAPVQAAGLSVQLDRDMHVAALRYHEAQGAFAQLCEAVLGVPLPSPLRAVQSGVSAGAGEFILAWRQPTHTLLLSADAAAFDAVQGRLLGQIDGCCLDQSGGLWVLRLQGRRVADLLLRVGSEASVPKPGETRISRIAELPVMSLSVRSGETLLLVDRVHAEHLFNWIRVTAADFSPQEAMR